MRIVAAILTALLLASLALNYHLFGELGRRTSTLSYLQRLNATLAAEAEELRPYRKSREEERERKAVVEEICRIRELPLKHPIRFSGMSREKLQEYIEGELEEQYPGDEMEYLMRALVRFGFTDEKFDLKEKIADLYTEQVGGLYDNDNDTLYLVEGAPATKNMAATFLAHEVIHALQDQDLGLDGMPLKMKGNDDTVMAAVALVEGDATVAMFQFYLSRMDAGIMADLASAMFTDSQEYSDAPDFIKENLLFPYVQGSAFVSALFADGGWKRVDGAYGRLPSSTEQIMHPAKYLEGGDEPVPIRLPDLEVFGWKKLLENVLGEFNSQVLLKSRIPLKDAETASCGWGGDRFGLYEQDGKEVLAWLSAWDTGADAGEFHRSFRAFLEMARDAGGDTVPAGDDDLTWSTDTEICFLGRRGREILFISGSPGTDIPAIRSAFGDFKREDFHEEDISG